MKKILYIAIAIFYLHMPEPVNANRFETSANNIVFAVPESQKFSVAQVGDALSSDGAQRAVTEGDPAGRNFVATMVIGSFQKDVAYTQYQYADGLGNAVETVYQGFTPQGNDLVSFQEYEPYRGFRHRLGRRMELMLDCPRSNRFPPVITRILRLTPLL